VNPARLVQAAQTPAHAGIFNGNFASPEPVEGGWDESGAVRRQHCDFNPVAALNAVQKNSQQTGILEESVRLASANQTAPTIWTRSLALNGKANGYQKLLMLIPIELRGRRSLWGFVLLLCR